MEHMTQGQIAKRTYNMIDYVTWRGDLPYASVPFNDVDGLVLACVSYLDFQGIVPGMEDGASVALSEAFSQLREKACGNLSPYVRSLARIGDDFASALSESRRFGDCRLSGYTLCLDEETTTQFSALLIELPGDVFYVSFRGTDATLVGWHEDFALSFRVTESQEMAATYLREAMERHPTATFMVGGHSKGGALAEFAAASVDAAHGNRISAVYSNDGPGLDPRLDAMAIRDVLGDKLHLVVPEYSLVGMLYADGDDPRRVFVRSTAQHGAQHDPLTWQVMPPGKFLLADGLDRDCKAVNDGFAKWADGIDLSERERMVSDVFSALGANGAKTLLDLTSTRDGMRETARALDGCDPRTKKAVADLIQSILNSSLSSMAETMSERAAAFRQSLGSSVASSLAKSVPSSSSQSSSQSPQSHERWS